MPITTNKNQDKTKLHAFLEELAAEKIIAKDEMYPLETNYQRPGQVIESLLSLGKTKEEKIIPVYAKFLGYQYSDLKDADSKYFSVVSRDLATKYWLLPYKFAEGVLYLAAAYPARIETGDLAVLDEVERETGTKIKLTFTTRENMERIFKSEPYQKVLGKPYWPSQLPRIQLVGRKIPPTIIGKIPPDLARKYQMIVFEAPSVNEVKIGVVDPANPKVRQMLDFLREKNDIKISVYIISPEDFNWALQQYLVIPKVSPRAPDASAIKQTPQQKISLRQSPKVPAGFSPPASPENAHQYPKPKELENIPEIKITDITPAMRGEAMKAGMRPVGLEEADLGRFLGKLPQDIDALIATAKEGSIPRLIASTIALAVYWEASDIHIEGWQDYIRIRYRIDGVLRDILLLPIQILPAMVARIKILSKLKIDEQRIPQDGRFDVRLQDRQIDLRVSTLPTIFGEKVVMRLLDKKKGIMSLKDLGMIGSGYDRVMEAIKKPWGIVMATGPTGSGKSTTLYAILQEIATSGVNVITLEDPVEYEIAGVNQVQVKPQIGFTFANGLRSILRQDPNVIMVGETRDGETANLVTHAALTGHLVLTTLHTNDAAGALPRLINMGVEPFLITSAINAIIAQRLVRKLCPECKEPTEIPPATLVKVKQEIGTLQTGEPLKFYSAKGCGKCNQGFKGRLGIYEVLATTPEIENLAVSRRSAGEIKKEAVRQGMVSLRQDGIIKALKGMTTIDEVFRVTTED